MLQKLGFCVKKKRHSQHKNDLNKFNAEQLRFKL